MVGFSAEIRGARSALPLLWLRWSLWLVRIHHQWSPQTNKDWNPIMLNAPERLLIGAVKSRIPSARNKAYYRCICVRLRKESQRDDCPLLPHFTDAPTETKFINGRQIIIRNASFMKLKAFPYRTHLRGRICVGHKHTSTSFYKSNPDVPQ